MKVLHVIVGLDAGGAELMLKRLVTELRSRGIESIVVSLTSTGVIGPELQNAGFEVRALGMRGPFSVLRGFFNLRRLIRRERPDVVQSWMYHADLIGGLASRSVGVTNVVWNIRQTDLSAGISRRTRLIRSLCARLSARVPKRIVAVAHAAKVMHVDAGYDESRVLVVPNGFDFARFQFEHEARSRMRRAIGVGEDEVLVGSMGRFNPIKDHPTFIKAAGIVAAKHPRVKFALAGRGVAPSNMMLRTLVDATGFADRFHLCDHVTDTPGYLSGLDVFCLHSRTEGFPNALGEAMAMGRYSVVTNVGDASLMLGDTGLVVPREDPLALAGALEAAVTMSRHVREGAGKLGRARLQREYSMDSVADQYAWLYRSLIQSAQ